MTELPLVVRARSFGEKIAIRQDEAEHTYADLLRASASLANALLQGRPDLAEARIAFQAPAGFDYFVIQWGIWRAGGVAVPLSTSAAAAEIDHALRDSGAEAVIVMSRDVAASWPLPDGGDCPVIVLADITGTAELPLPGIDLSRRAMILFTSGTTNKPKGVVTTHANIAAQIGMLVQAWEWSADDSIPLFLPMHHVHGIINVASCALWSGACIETFAKFEMDRILRQVLAGAYTLFMAVPTIYVKLLEAFASASDRESEPVLAGFRAMRLMVSGSAALPASIFGQWRTLTGQALLERYGMTETGMILSNPYQGERRPGSVGLPLPGVEVRLMTEQGTLVTVEDEPGEIQVRGPAVFLEYWNSPGITRSSFDGGWFRTGDLAVMESGYYRIMGRLSVDIIKSGGYKLSALEIEAALLEHPSIRECAVVGIKDDTWGEMVGVAAVLKDQSTTLDLDELRAWSRGRLSHYKVPRKLLLLDSLPRNAMGKVTKNDVSLVLHAVP